MDGRLTLPLRRPVVAALAVLALLALGAGCGGDVAPEDPFVDLTRGNVTLTDQGWYCGSRVDVDRLEVTVRHADVDAIHLARGCTGRIGELIVVQYRRDGVKVSAGAHDLVVEKGTIECRAQKPESHQDGIQAMGGHRVTFRNVRVDCPTRSSGFFVRRGGRDQELPVDILCVGCFIRGGSYSVRLNDSVRSGIRDSTVCSGRFGPIKILDGAIDPVDVRNRFVTCA
jgi:hypothetical protein